MTGACSKAFDLWQVKSWFKEGVVRRLRPSCALWNPSWPYRLVAGRWPFKPEGRVRIPLGLYSVGEMAEWFNALRC